MSSSTVSFAKLQGSGNDFIFFDFRKSSFFIDAKAIIQLCDRRFGIGADGVIIVETSTVANYRMRIFNADGSEAERCGNGLCCFYRYLQDEISEKSITVETPSGVIALSEDGGRVVIKMADHFPSAEEHLLSSGERVFFLNTGVPHTVCFVENLKDIDIAKRATHVQKQAFFAKEGTNVNYVEIMGPNTLKIRTFERGVNQETLACGTGATASALIAMQECQLASPLKTINEGGDAVVEAELAEDGFKKVYFKGRAEYVFSGKIDMSIVSRSKDLCSNTRAFFSCS